MSDIYWITATTSSKEKNLGNRAEIFATDYLPYIVSEGWIDASDEVLEIGCGQGHKWEVLLNRFPWLRYRWVELSETMIRRARERLPDIPLYHANAVDLSGVIPQGSQDVICLFQMWHHLDEASQIRVGHELNRILRPGWKVLLLDSFRWENPFGRVAFDIANRFYAILSQYPIESVRMRFAHALMGTIAPLERYNSRKLGYFSPTIAGTRWVMGHAGLQFVEAFCPGYLYIADLLVFEKPIHSKNR